MENQIYAGVYEHYKGLFVNVLGLARHSETNELLVAYIPLAVKEGPRMTVRPLQMFMEEVEVDGEMKPRFRYLGSTMPTHQ